MTEEKKEGDQPNRIMVYLRIRSAKPNEINEKDGTSYLMDLQPDNKTVVLEGGKQYNFDHVFDGPGAKNSEIYTLVGRPVVENIFKGFWGTLLVYGQTGTGKSYTMCNFDRGNEGIIPNAMQDIFNRAANEPDRKYTVVFSFIQIYLDKLQDLFNPNAAKELKLTRDAKGVAFPGITERTCSSYEEFLENYNDGHQYRVITATKMNPESSRGHAALFIQVRSVPKDDPSGEIRNGKLFMIDLAGYERFSKTGVQEGIMKEEAKTINGSLLSLGNVVQSLAEGSEHVPWRNAKLTRMLEDAIGGRAKCSIILTAGPSSEHVHETLGTLYFGSRAMSVKTTATATISVDYKKLAAKLQLLLTAAESKISTLELEAQKRALEREETEMSMQQELASLKKRQEASLQKMIAEGAPAEKIQELMAANKLEQELLEEQQYTQRSVMEERHEAEIAEANKKREEQADEEVDTERSGMSNEVSKLQRELKRTRDELDAAKAKAKDAESEARRLMNELSDAKVALAKNGIEVEAPGAEADDLMGGPQSPRSAQPANANAKALLANPDMRKEMDRRIAAVKAMLEETHQLRLQEVEEPLQEDVIKYKALYEEAKETVGDQLQVQKDTLSAQYEGELEEMRRTANEVQERLKKNHMTVKMSYQKQREALQEENDQLTRQLGDIQARLASDVGKGGPAPVSAAGGKAPSLAEVMIMKKQTERKVEELQQHITDLKSDVDYIATERDDLKRQLKEYEPSAGEERMKPAAMRKLKEQHEQLQQDKTQLETELFKLRAEQALSGPQRISSTAEDDGGDGDLDAQEDMMGDTEGIKVFCDRLLQFPYFQGKERLKSDHANVLSTLTLDLDEYRRSMRIRVMMVGAPGAGKSSVMKCMTTPGVSMMRSVPEVQPTLHPAVQMLAVDDTGSNRSDWHTMYVDFKDPQAEKALAPAASFRGLSRLMGGGPTTDPAKVHIDLVDMPGTEAFWRGMPSSLLQAKNVCYTVVYNLNTPLHVIRDDVGKQLRTIHASAHRASSRTIGGEAPRVAVCLVGTNRDGVRENKDAQIIEKLNKVVVSLGDCFFKLRGDDTYGLVLIGNFAVSCRDWTVLGTRGAKGPTNFRELLTYIGVTANKLSDTRPSALLPSTKERTSHTKYTLNTADEAAALDSPTEDTTQMSDADKRLRKGIVTLLTLLAREVRVRWIMSDAELRRLVAHHIGVVEDTRAAVHAVNFIIRELACRGVILPLPSVMYEPKYLPKHKDDYPSADYTPHPRDCVIVIDPLRILVFYSAFVGPQHFTKVPKEALKDKNATLFDVALLEKLDAGWRQGIVSQQVIRLTHERFVALTSREPRLMQEVLCVLGCGFLLRQDASMISPVLFSRPMAPGFIDYLSYLLSNHGDGIGRKYHLNTIPGAFFARLQLALLPFSHLPSRDEHAMMQNWTDGSYLVFDRSRLKHGLYGSKVVKDAVMASTLPVRGLLKVEGQHLFVAVTARGPTTPAMVAAVRPMLNAIHHHITVLCRREFRGVNAEYQEMTIAGCSEKRGKLKVGIETILNRVGASVNEVQSQQAILGALADPKGSEIDAALLALPADVKME